MKISLFLLPVLAAGLILTACTKKEENIGFIGGSTPLPSGFYAPQAAAGKELMAATQSREEAEKLAALYGIELADWGEGIACFHTDEDPYAVIRRGRENGWPTLEINHVITLDDPVVSGPFPGIRSTENGTEDQG